jgi:hypothetical protein
MPQSLFVGSGLRPFLAPPKRLREGEAGLRFSCYAGFTGRCPVLLLMPFSGQKIYKRDLKRVKSAHKTKIPRDVSKPYLTAAKAMLVAMVI